jgi:hypothetical protein
MPLFYSVQSRQDADRLTAGGEPWPAGLQRANMGSGFYAWETPETAEAYRRILEDRGVAELRVVVYEVAQADLDALRKLDLTLLSDPEVEEWMARHSHYGAAEPHDWEYVIRGTDKGTEHYFAAAVFARLREVR